MLRLLLKLLVYVGSAICCALLVLSGFGPLLITNEPITGYVMLMHIGVAGFFSISVALFALFSSTRHIFTKPDQLLLRYMLLGNNDSRITASTSAGFWMKICYWLMLIVALPLMLSIALSMFPLFGPEGQETLRSLHIHSAFSMTLMIICYSCTAMVYQFKKFNS